MIFETHAEEPDTSAAAVAPLPLPNAVHVINLDCATARLEGMLAGFDSHLAGSGLALNRFAAVDVAYVQAAAVPGALRWAEKACFLSHARCLASATGGNTPVWIVEDDVLFGPATLPRLRAALDRLAGQRWDVLATDLLIVEPHGMIDLFRMSRDAQATGRTDVLELDNMNFIATGSYLVHPDAIAPLLTRMRALSRLDMAIDVWLREEMRQGRLISRAVLPFATAADWARTQIQPEAARRPLAWWTAFRRLLWQHDDRDALDRHLQALEDEYAGADADARRLGRILAGMLACAPANVGP